MRHAKIGARLRLNWLGTKTNAIGGSRGIRGLLDRITVPSDSASDSRREAATRFRVVLPNPGAPTEWSHSGGLGAHAVAGHWGHRH